MPELPEVEIVKQSLNKKIRGKIIQKVSVKNRNLRFKLANNFEKKIRNKKIIQIDRFSKYIILKFKDNSGFILHLGMSGTIHLVDKIKKNTFTNSSFYHSPNLPKKHNHIEIKFKKIKLVYNDPRRFGYILIFKNKEDLKKKFSHFGPEPFSNSFSVDYIINYLKNKEKNIKNFLLDQKFVSGIGNIYANEILFYCKINPFKLAKKISYKDILKISKYSKYVLNLAIEYGGSSIRDFKNTKGASGSFQNEFKVYDRENKNCPTMNCRNKISKIFLSNRSTFFCKLCQK